MPDYIAVGDIHGMAHLLDELLRQLPAAGELILLGDYIDRGPDSRAVIDRLIRLRDERICHFLRGNHEEMLFGAMAGAPGAEVHWLRNGGTQTLDNYGGRPPAEHIAFLRQTERYFTTPDYIFVHAGLLPGVPPEEHASEDCLWIRDPFLLSDYDWGKLVIHGHTPTRNHTPDVCANRINIDTGAVYGGTLTAILLPEREFLTAGRSCVQR